MSVRVIISCPDLPKIRDRWETPALPQASMRFVLPTSGLDVPCAVPTFTGIHVVIAQPAYSVYVHLVGLHAKREFQDFFMLPITQNIGHCD